MGIAIELSDIADNALGFLTQRRCELSGAVLRSAGLGMSTAMGWTISSSGLSKPDSNGNTDSGASYVVFGKADGGRDEHWARLVGMITMMALSSTG